MELFECNDQYCKLIIRADDVGSKLDHVCLDCGFIYNADNYLDGSDDCPCDSYNSCPHCGSEVGTYDVGTGEISSNATDEVTDAYSEINIECPKCGSVSTPYTSPA